MYLLELWMFFLLAIIEFSKVFMLMTGVLESFLLPLEGVDCNGLSFSVKSLFLLVLVLCYLYPQVQVVILTIL